MRDEDILAASLIDDSWIPIEKIATVCHVEIDWLLGRLDDGLFPEAEISGSMCRISSITLLRIRRMWQVERDFDAMPELAALVADCLEEVDVLRAQVGYLQTAKK